MIIYIFLFLLGSKFSLASTTIEEIKNNILTSNANYSIYIKNIKTNTVLLSINAKTLLKPASNLKLVVGASILKGLGTRYRYETNIYLDKNKNLIIKGSGDPSFSSKKLNLLSKILKTNKTKFIENIIGIKSIFDNQKIGLMWSWDDLTNCYSAQISGLQINYNCIRIDLKPSRNNYPILVKQETEIPYLYIKNNAYTRLFANKKISVSRTRNTNTVIINGEMAEISKPISRFITVNEPSKYFLNITRNILQKKGIIINKKNQIASEIGYKLNKKLKPILTIHSRYIKYLLRDFLQHSINLYGESFLKTLGYAFFNKGSTYNGRIAIKMLLRSYNLPNKEIFIADGSGLSELNLASANYFVKLLEAVYKDSFYRTFKETLSIAGIAGTLKNTLNIKELKGKVFAKTGHLNGVIALSGYLYTKSKNVLAFSFIFNDIKNNYEIEKLIKKTLIKLANL